MQTPILCQPLKNLVLNSAVRYSTLVGGGQVSSTALPRTRVAEAGELSMLTIGFGAALSSGTMVVTVMINNVDSALTVTLGAGDQFKVDSTHSVSVSAGDDVMIKWAPASTPDITTVATCSLVFTGTTAGKSIISASHLASASAIFLALGNSPASGTETTVTVVAPTSGTISKMYVRRPTATGAGQTVTYTLRKGASGGAMADTALAVTVDNSTTTPPVSTSTVSVAAGDFLSIGMTISGTPASSIGTIGLDWTPDTDGEALLFGIATGFSASANRFIPANGEINPEATESDAYSIAPIAFTAKKLYGRVTTAPGSGKSYTDTLMIAGAAQTLTAAVADTNTTLTPDTTHNVSVSALNLIDLKIAPSGTPTNYGAMAVGMVAYTGTAAATGYGNLMLMGVG